MTRPFFRVRWNGHGLVCSRACRPACSNRHVLQPLYWNAVEQGYNPYTGTTGREAQAYNPYTGKDVQEKKVYNPYTGTTAEARKTTNPYTGRSTYSYAYRRR